MLVDAAKHGDVEIPVFCYEPKLGQPVGACRMCLVEIEGIPKLQTALLDAGQGRHGRPHPDRARARGAAARWSSSCSSTTRSTARSATRAASARCRTSPTAGARGTSRFIEPKRHFKKPLELSPLIAIDRERCILCYRCVRFSQEISEDYQLILHERGAHSYVGTFDGHPYVGAVLRQHHRAVPGRRAHLARVPLPRAAVGHRGRRHGLHAVPGAVQRRADGARRARACACSRATTTTSTTAGCATRAASPTSTCTSTSASSSRSCARAPSCMPASWEKALAAAGGALEEGGRQARRRWPAARPPTRRRFLLAAPVPRGARLRPPGLARRPASCRLDVARALADPALQADGPRPRVRPRRAAARLRPDRRRADPRPAHPQGRAPPRRQARAWRARGRPRSTRTRRGRCGTRPARARRCWRRSTPRSATSGDLGGAATAAGTNADVGARPRRLPARRRRGPRDRLRRARADARGARRARCSTSPRGSGSRPRRRRAARAPAAANARGIREAGFAPATAPATRRSPRRPRRAGIAAGWPTAS